MSQAPPPIPGSTSTPKTSGLAIWSLVLGILSLTCFSIFAAVPGVICGHKALSRIKRSGGGLGGQGMAIAGLVLGYFGIVMLPLMMVVAIPNFMKARAVAQQNICIGHLQMIDSAKQQWVKDNNKQAKDIPTEKDLAPYLGSMPKCPNDGTYSINAADQAPTCSIPGHHLN